MTDIPLLPNNQALAIAQDILDGIQEVLNEAGTAGVPSGILYAALMPVFTLDEYMAIMAAFVKTGRATKIGQVFYTTRKG